MSVDEIVRLIQDNHDLLKDKSVDTIEVEDNLGSHLTELLVTCRGFSRTNFKILSEKMEEVGLFIHYRTLESDRFGPLRMGVDVWDNQEDYESEHQDDFIRYTLAFG